MLLNSWTFWPQDEAAIVRAKIRHALAVAGRAHRLANSDAGGGGAAAAAEGG